MKDKTKEIIFTALFIICPFIFVILDLIFWNKVACPKCKNVIDRKVKCPHCGAKQNNPQCPHCGVYLSWS